MHLCKKLCVVFQILTENNASKMVCFLKRLLAKIREEAVFMDNLCIFSLGNSWFL